MMQPSNGKADKVKTLILFRGPCGSGKTHIRSRMGLDKTKGFDLADFPRDAPIDERINASAAWLLDHAKEKAVWIEGIFAPGSPSLEALLDVARRQKRNVQHIIVNAAPDVLKARIGDDSERLRLAVMYHNKFTF